MEPRNRCQGINSASLCSMAGRYDNPIPTRCLAPIDFLKFQLCSALRDYPYFSSRGPDASARCFKQIWKVGKVGMVGKVGKVGKAGKVGKVFFNSCIFHKYSNSNNTVFSLKEPFTG